MLIGNCVDRSLFNYHPDLGFKDFPEDDLILDLDGEKINHMKVELPDVIPAIPTLYLEDGRIDMTSLDIMIEKQAKAGIKAVLIAGTTGESSFLDHEEHINYIKIAVGIGKKYGVKIVAGTGYNYTKEQNQLTEGAFKCGAAASLLLAPFYIGTTDALLIRHFTKGLNYGPGIIYSIKDRTTQPISNEVIEVLSKHPNFLGVKECDGPEKIRGLVDMGIRVWTGDDKKSFWDIHESGADGSISVVCNLDPELIQEIKEGVGITKAKIDRLLNLSHLMFIRRNPIPVHNAIEMIRNHIGIITGPCTFRSPGGPLNIKQQNYLAEGLTDLGINAKPFGNNCKIIYN